MKKSPIYSKAFEYAVHGYSVMPLKKDKKPILASWKNYQSTAADEAKITEWWEKNPDANVGIITGRVSGITVIDIDDPTAVPVTTFPKTFTVKTPSGGYHLYYKYAEGFSISANQYAQYPHVDIRGDGGFIVAPPSECEYEKNKVKIKGSYTVVHNAPLAPFPSALFGAKKDARKLGTLLDVGAGKRNDSMASLIGKLLHAAPVGEWGTEVWPAVERMNKTYAPPLSPKELKITFDSIVKKEKARRKSFVVSPFQVEDGEDVEIPLRRNVNGALIKDMANALAVLEHHPFYKETLKYNEFRQEIEYKGKVIEDADLTKMQYFMQKDIGLSSISKDAVMAAVQYCASKNSYDEAKDWINSLKWDKKPRLATWVHKATGVEDDSYHAGIGAQWFAGLVRRMMYPGCIFDYVLVLVGSQGIGKTSLFRIIGGPWYKNYTGAMDNKDFFLALRGAVIVDLDEGASLYRSDAIKIKSVITNTNDEYRAPYDRLMKRYPRRFVFSMSTNDTEPFRDVTGNRRYWTIDGKEKINFKWLEDNRDQLYAEAWHCIKNNIALPEVPMEEALAHQEDHLPDDPWSPIVYDILHKSKDYVKGSALFQTTVLEMFRMMFPEENVARLGRGQEMRIAAIFKAAGLQKVRSLTDGERKTYWGLTFKKGEQLRALNLTASDDFGGL